MICLLFLPIALSGQRQPVRHLFCGFIDGVQEVCLSCQEQDDGILAGTLEYRNSGFSIRILGTRTKSGFRWKEINHDGLYCGVIEVANGERGLTGYWYNGDRTIRAPIILYRVESKDFWRETNGEGLHSLRVYSGVLRGGALRLYVMSVPGFPERGALFYGGMRQRWELEEMAQSGDTTEYSISDEAGQEKGMLVKVGIGATDSIFVKVHGLIDGRLEGSLQQEVNWTGVCRGVSEYAVQRHAFYFVPDNEVLEAILTKHSMEWLDEAERLAAGLEGKYKGHKDRAKYRYDAWFEPIYVSPFLVSGYWLMTGPGQERIRSVNYDLSGQQVLTWDNLFAKGTNYRKLIAQHIDREIQNRPDWQEKSVSRYLREAEFLHFVIRKSGLEVFTDYSPVFGRLRVVIPWSDLDGRLANPSMLGGHE